MNGFQLTFFTEQSTNYQHLPLGEWLVEFAKREGALGATLVSGTEGLDHLGHLHTAHFLGGADHPVTVTISTLMKLGATGCWRHWPRSRFH